MAVERQRPGGRVCLGRHPPRPQQRPGHAAAQCRRQPQRQRHRRGLAAGPQRPGAERPAQCHPGQRRLPEPKRPGRAEHRRSGPLQRHDADRAGDRGRSRPAAPQCQQPERRARPAQRWRRGTAAGRQLQLAGPPGRQWRWLRPERHQPGRDHHAPGLWSQRQPRPGGQHPRQPDRAAAAGQQPGRPADLGQQPGRGHGRWGCGDQRPQAERLAPA